MCLRTLAEGSGRTSRRRASAFSCRTLASRTSMASAASRPWPASVSASGDTFSVVRPSNTFRHSPTHSSFCANPLSAARQVRSAAWPRPQAWRYVRARPLPSGRLRQNDSLRAALRVRAKNAVSERFISQAMACIVAAGSHASSGQTAAGLPVSGRSAKASMMKIDRSMARVLLIAPPLVQAATPEPLALPVTTGVTRLGRHRSRSPRA